MPLVLPPPAAEIRVRHDVLYSGDLEADVYSPAAGGHQATILFIHGGPVPEGAKPKGMRMFGDYGALAAAMGFTGITFNHRFFGSDIGRAAEDVEALIAFARLQPEVDPQRLFLWAFSGGGLFLTLAFDRSDVRGAVAYYAVLDVIAREGSNAVTSAIRARFSPLERLRAGAAVPPLFLACAGRDLDELKAAQERFVGEALRRNVEIELMTHPDGLHGFDILNDDERSRSILRRTFEFIREHMPPM